MTIAVGHILDKYELIEKVGQGGMAVVYRGLDRTLQRAVAVKVLHQHLAEFKEARDRFEREARAVAKLRHENILEIYDFSGSGSDESYIVTEFIDGQTLCEFTDEYRIKYPEVGAMITIQVCRALGHAHSLGILHRDVKPENVMIRSDGVVKLTDFGIAQMIDIERMTVTGQLLGSPAYMSPEHVEGGELDFRTDVFAVGIVLYQLVTGELPFKGKNPHETLKRIAECEFVDPRQQNPRVGNELGRIINRALARLPDDRYPDISEMLTALEGYVIGSGLEKYREELARFFAAPASYEMALRERLIAHLSRRGRESAATDQVAAIELFNRVLTIDPENDDVLAVIDHMSRRRRGTRALALFGGILAIAAVVYAGLALWPAGREPAGPDDTAGIDETLRPGGSPKSASGEAQPGSATGAGVARHRPSGDVLSEVTPAATANASGDATPAATPHPCAAPGIDRADPPIVVAVDAGSATALASPTPPTRTPDRRPVHPPPRPDAGGAIAPVIRRYTLVVSVRQSEFRIDEGPWRPIAGQSAQIEVAPGNQVIEVRNQCCQSVKQSIPADDPGGRELPVTLGYLPARITAKCVKPGVRVQIDGKSAPLGQPWLIPITSTLAKRVTVRFFGERTDTQLVKVKYNESRVVTCKFD